ncbi:LLM class flavin-dependent oxidoreductase [Sulfidibacter corallicola]|uniref:LLM class flavin-dependent oxidoreductase n=1 Tax=Sulfidibacter corallicola TaxID=2818388 RepID=A0A8A4TMU7_SULCO|nr:MupA/Atu3671 family FMN-dependent luciferase-like monooxygenase [Sulfidibacter corallicola]QTD50238.1 LLM class flavin-dependent oxidoreductase [Sulfidibacter corallicola]
MSATVEQLLGFQTETDTTHVVAQDLTFSFLFFSDVRTDVTDAEKYGFMRDLTLFADREGFEAVYIPERHFYEFGSIFANSAVVAAHLIPQTERVRFRTAGISLPLHHPAEVVEWWAINDILSGGRVDLGFGSGWNQADFIYSPDTFDDRRAITSERIEQVRRLWRGETLSFPGPEGKDYPIRIFPRPLQPELNVWLLAASSDAAFTFAGEQGYNVFTMLYSQNFEAMGKKIERYRQGRRDAGLDPAKGTVSLMLHTLVHKDLDTVQWVVEKPFKSYIKSALEAHVNAGLAKLKGAGEVGEAEKAKMLEYAYQRYFRTSAIFGPPEQAREVVEQARAIGVNDIACVMDFGVDYDVVKDSFPYLKQLISRYV